MPYWSLAIKGFSEMNVNSLRRQVNGRGTIRAIKMTISKTRRKNTWDAGQHTGSIFRYSL